MKHVVALLSLWAVSLPAADFDRRGFEEELDTLATSSREEGAACEATFVANDRVIHDVTEAADGELYYAKKPTAERAYEILRDYPGLPPSSVRVLEMIQKFVPKGTKINLGATYRLGDCRTIGNYSIAKRLAYSARKLRFSQSERAELRAAELHYLRKDLGGALTLLQLITRLDVMRVLDETHLVPLDAERRSRLTELRREGERLRHFLRTEGDVTVENVRAELDAIDTLRAQTRRLLAGL